jgi:hypothetical protein
MLGLPGFEDGCRHKAAKKTESRAARVDLDQRSPLRVPTDLGLFNRDFRLSRERTSSVSRTTFEKCHKRSLLIR